MRKPVLMYALEDRKNRKPIGPTWKLFAAYLLEVADESFYRRLVFLSREVEFALRIYLTHQEWGLAWFCYQRQMTAAQVLFFEGEIEQLEDKKDRAITLMKNFRPKMLAFHRRHLASSDLKIEEDIIMAETLMFQGNYGEASEIFWKVIKVAKYHKERYKAWFQYCQSRLKRNRQEVLSLYGFGQQLEFDSLMDANAYSAYVDDRLCFADWARAASWLSAEFDKGLQKEIFEKIEGRYSEYSSSPFSKLVIRKVRG